MDGFTGTGLACIRSERIVFAGLDFSVTPGEALVLSGPNGSGKSTTMRMLTGFLSPSAGTAAICGIDVRDDPVRARRHVGYLPEGAPAYPDMTLSLIHIPSPRDRG